MSQPVIKTGADFFAESIGKEKIVEVIPEERDGSIVIRLASGLRVKIFPLLKENFNVLVGEEIREARAEIVNEFRHLVLTFESGWAMRFSI